MDETTIGEKAGLIWRHLARQGKSGSTLLEIEKLKEVGPQEALAAVGWLAREGKLDFVQEEGSLKVRLAVREIERAST